MGADWFLPISCITLTQQAQAHPSFHACIRESPGYSWTAIWWCLSLKRFILHQFIRGLPSLQVSLVDWWYRWCRGSHVLLPPWSNRWAIRTIPNPEGSLFQTIHYPSLRRSINAIWGPVLPFHLIHHPRQSQIKLLMLLTCCSLWPCIQVTHIINSVSTHTWTCNIKDEAGKNF